jgi:hypothetical protein
MPAQPLNMPLVGKSRAVRHTIIFSVLTNSNKFVNLINIQFN